jgi:hypothetical protein
MLALAVFATGLVAGCGGTVDITCDEVEYYQTAKIGKRVEAPEGLDDLDPIREMPLPEASPRDPRPAGSPCFDRPPQIELGAESG